MPHTITIFLDGPGWMARDNDPEVLALFGTDTIPLPFLASTPAGEALAVLRQLNPDATVEVAP